MKQFKSAILILLGLVIASFGFAILWVRTPALWFINLPSAVWDFLQRLSGAACCESSADLEFVGGMLLGLLLSSLALLVFFLSKKACAALQARRITSKP